MATKKFEGIKTFFLMSFMIASIGLIFAQWADGLIDQESESPSYYRETAVVNDSMYVTLTAVARGYELGTGTPVREHKNEQNHTTTPGYTPTPSYTPTPKPTTDWDAVEQDQ